MSVEELRTLILDQSTAMTNALEASQAQNREFQSTLLGYSRWLARNTEADAATSTAVINHTIIQSTEKDTYFPEWDGDRARLPQWLHQAEQIKRTKQLSDQLAVQSQKCIHSLPLIRILLTGVTRQLLGIKVCSDVFFVLERLGEAKAVGGFSDVAVGRFSGDEARERALCVKLRGGTCVLLADAAGRPAGPVQPGELRGPEQSRARLCVLISLPCFGLSTDVNRCSRRVVDP